MGDLVELIILRPTVIEGAHVKKGDRVEVDRATARILLAGTHPKAARLNGVDPTAEVFIDTKPKPKRRQRRAVAA